MFGDFLDGRVVVITGGGQGLGRAYARRFAEQGAIAVVADINAGSADRVVAEITEQGGNAMAVAVDVGDEASVHAMVDAVRAEHGRIDVLINNAAVFSTLTMQPFDEIPLSEWEQVMRVNVTGAFLCARAVVPIMRESGWGRIINVSSATVSMGRPMYLHYVTSKAALIGFTRSLAREVGGDGITVNVVLPGATYSEVPRATVTEDQKSAIVAMQCIPRPEEPRDLEGAMVFLASEASGFITGQSLTVDGGLTHT